MCCLVSAHKKDESAWLFWPVCVWGGGELEELMALWISLCDTLRKRHVCIVISEEVVVAAACCGVLPCASDCSLSLCASIPASPLLSDMFPWSWAPCVSIPISPFLNSVAAESLLLFTLGEYSVTSLKLITALTFFACISFPLPAFHYWLLPMLASVFQLILYTNQSALSRFSGPFTHTFTNQK